MLVNEHIDINTKLGHDISKERRLAFNVSTCLYVVY